MKTSNYNLFFKHKDKFIGYNTLYNTFLIIDNQAFPLLLKGMRNLLSFASACKNTFQLLQDKKFIIDNDVDEIAIAKSVLYQTNYDNSKFRITINPTLNCNFHCWYCYETHAEGTKITVETKERILKFIKHTIDINASLKHLYLDWFGGEPLLYFKDVVSPILLETKKYAEAKGIEFISGFTTNGYLLTDDILDFCILYSAKNFQITLDGHKERHNQVRFTHSGSNTYDKIVHNIKSAIIKGANVNVRLNISSDTKADVVAILNSFKGLEEQQLMNLHFSIHEVWQEREKVGGEIENILNLIRYYGFNANIYETSPHGISNTCYADKENEAVINYDGSIFKCTARNFLKENSEGYLTEDGKIEWNSHYEKRKATSVFNYPECHQCSIMPICNAGCSQQQLEHPEHFCMHSFSKVKKMNFAKKVVLEGLYRLEETRALV